MGLAVPFGRYVPHRKKQQLQKRIIGREHRPSLCNLPQLPVEAFYGIGCIDHPTDILWVVKHRDEMIPMSAPSLGNHRILILPISIKLLKGFQGLLCMISALLLVGAYWIAAWRVYRRAGRMLGERLGSGLVPLFLLLRPWTTWRYAMMGKKENKSYFTWQYLR